MRASINGAEIFYELVGEGPPILLMHGGMGLDHTYFRPWLDRLGDSGHLVFYDHRGNGLSARPEDWNRIDHDTWIADAEALRDHLGFDKIVLFGHSYGGFLAQAYALRYQDRLSGLILSNTAPAFDYPDLVLENARLRGGAEQLDALGLALSTRAPDDETAGIWWRAIFPLYFHDPDPALLDEVADRIRYSSGAWNRSIFELMPSFDVLEQLRSLQVPTLVLGGADDWIMPPGPGAERLHVALPKSDLIIFDECGHFPWLEAGDAFLGAIRSWLGRLHLPRTS